MDTFSTFGVSDKTWKIVGHLFDSKKTGRPRIHSSKKILDAIFFVGKTGCQWNLLPDSFPPWKTVYNYFRTWSNQGIFEVINDLWRKSIRICFRSEKYLSFVRAAKHFPHLISCKFARRRKTDMIMPKESTMRCRFLPLTLLLPSKPAF